MLKFLGGRLNPEEHPVVILADGCFGSDWGKMAAGVLRYGPWRVTAVIDQNTAGRAILDMIGVASKAPIVRSLAEALDLLPRPKVLLIGTTPTGGALSEHFRAVIREAIDSDLHVINGLHTFLNAQDDLRALASKRDVLLWDVRHVPDGQSVARQLTRPKNVKVITTVGSDCSVGKMSTALEIQRALAQRGKSAQFLATGQTGIVISGFGIPLDRVIGDFMAGAVEKAILELIQAENPDWIIVEGQGSLLHPAYSGVTLSLLHGSAPEALIFCHEPNRVAIAEYEKVKVPPVKEMIRLYETATRWIKPAQVVGVGLNTFALPEEMARGLIRSTQAETGLAVTDAVRYGAEVLVEALIRHFGEAST